MRRQGRGGSTRHRPKSSRHQHRRCDFVIDTTAIISAPQSRPLPTESAPLPLLLPALAAAEVYRTLWPAPLLAPSPAQQAAVFAHAAVVVQHWMQSHQQLCEVAAWQMMEAARDQPAALMTATQRATATPEPACDLDRTMTAAEHAQAGFSVTRPNTDTKINLIRTVTYDETSSPTGDGGEMGELLPSPTGRSGKGGQDGRQFEGGVKQT